MIAPTFHGGDGYSEDWTVDCPHGCGERLGWQRFLHGRMDPGRYVCDDHDVHACPGCGNGLDGQVPAGVPR